MEKYYVIDISIDRPHIKSTVYLPLYVRHVTGVLFFPVITPPADGVPDGDWLGIAGLSLENEKLNVVTNAKIFKKTPVYYESTDYKTAQGEIFLDRGYTRHDFFECNDRISGNSFLIFKYTNRKLIIAENAVERFNTDYNRLKKLVSESVVYRGLRFNILSLELVGDIIRIRTNWIFRTYEIHKDDLAVEIYKFIDPSTGEPFYKDEDNDGYDQPFTMKIILRYDE